MIWAKEYYFYDSGGRLTNVTSDPTGESPGTTYAYAGDGEGPTSIHWNRGYWQYLKYNPEGKTIFDRTLGMEAVYGTGYPDLTRLYNYTNSDFGLLLDEYSEVSIGTDLSWDTSDDYISYYAHFSHLCEWRKPE